MIYNSVRQEFQKEQSDFESQKNEFRRRLGGSLNTTTSQIGEFNPGLDTIYQVINFDWLLNIPRSEYLRDTDSQYKVVYTLYQNDSDVISNPVHQTFTRQVNNLLNVDFDQESHFINALSHSDDLCCQIIFEVQRKLDKGEMQRIPQQKEDELFSGYLLSSHDRYYQLAKSKKSEAIEDEIYMSVGWTSLDIVNFKQGSFKLPLYNLPISLDNLATSQPITPYSFLLLRLNEQDSIPSSYHIPPPHMLAPTTQQVLPPPDPSQQVYQCEGLHLTLHWVKGHQHQRFVRVACALQFGKEIIKQDSNHQLCFYASRGIQYPPRQEVEKNLKKEPLNEFFNEALTYHKEKVVKFGESKSWYKNLYHMYWHDQTESGGSSVAGKRENVYVILQFLELKP